MQREAYFRVISPIAEQRIKDGLCPNCGKPKSEWKRRTDWRCCSVECTDNYYKEFDKSYSWETFRYEIFKRDDSTCKMCGKRYTLFRQFIPDGKTVEIPDESNLIADHILPIVLGGEMWEKDNIETLCVDCNKIKTKADMVNIAKHRKRIKKWHERTDCNPRLMNPFVAQESLV